MSHALRALALVFASAVCSCQGAVERTDQAALGGDVAARVGRETIPVSLVERVSTEQRVSPRDALARLVDDAVAADAARARGMASRAPAAWLMRAALARMTADHLRQEAQGAGPPTDEEVRALSERYWQTVDRPEGLRVIHAIVKRPKDPSLAPRAKATAEDVRAAVASAKSPEEFKTLASAVSHPKEVEILVESLPAFAPDGRVVEGGGAMIESFARAAATLKLVGDTTGLVETTFGWHVIRLVERVPEERMPMEARRVAFADETTVLRARTALDARLIELRQRHPVEVSPAAATVLQSFRTNSESPTP